MVERRNPINKVKNMTGTASMTNEAGGGRKEDAEGQTIVSKS